MGFSSIAVEQREKEADSLRSFLAFSLIGSLALHIAVLTLGIGNLFNKAPEIEEEPIEVMLVEPPAVEAAKPKEETEEGTQEGTQSSGGRGAAGGAGSAESIEVAGGPVRGRQSSTKTAPPSPPKAAARVNAPPAPPIIAEKQPTPIATPPIEKLVDNLEPEPAPPPKPVQTPVAISKPKPAPPPKPVQTPVAISKPKPLPPLKPVPLPKPIQTPEAISTPKPLPPLKPVQTPLPQIAAERKPVITPSPIPSISPKPAPIPQRVPVAVNRYPQDAKPAAPNSLSPQTRGQDTEELRDQLRETRNSRESQGIAANSNDSGQRTDTGTGKKPGSGSSIAAGPGTAREGTLPGDGEGEGDRTGSGSGRLACRNCGKPKYPRSARQQGLEGTAKLSIDVDADGNVTNVEVVRSTGHPELDEAAIKAAKRWKFEAPEDGRKGVPATVDFVLEES